MNAAQYLLSNDTPGSKVALLTLTGEYSYADLRRGVRQITGYLRQSGAVKGDRIVLVAESTYFWVVAYLGIIQAGCVVVPLPVTMDADECAYILDSTECERGFLQGKYADAFQPALKRNIGLVVDDLNLVPEALARKVIPFAEVLKISKTSTSAKADVSEPVEVDDRHDLAALMFTSGSTGQPRGVMVSHRNIIANTDSIIEYLNLTAEDRIMAVLPFYYCFGTSLLHTHLRVGGSVVTDTRFIFTDKVLSRMQETCCTGFAGVPSTFQIMLRKSSMKKMQFPYLRYVQQAGGKLPDIFIQELREALPATRVFVMYGQTEATARLSYLPPEMLDVKFGSIGKGIPGVQLQVLDETDSPVLPGVVGEIVAEGDNITLGYWRSPEETGKSFRKGRLYSGDMARVDEDGYIYVVDRAKDFLKCGGQRVSCLEIESTILKFEGIIEAAAIGQPDDVLGEAVRLYVVHPSGEAIRSELEQFCAAVMPWNLVPKTIVFMSELPKNSAGKMDRFALKILFRVQQDQELKK